MELVMLKNFIHNLEVAINGAGGDSSEPRGDGKKLVSQAAEGWSKERIDSTVRASDTLKAQHGSTANDAGDRVGDHIDAGDRVIDLSMAPRSPPLMHNPKVKPSKPNDLSGWLTLPYESNWNMKQVSKAAAGPLRHFEDFDRDSEQGVKFDRLYRHMHK